MRRIAVVKPVDPNDPVPHPAIMRSCYLPGSNDLEVVLDTLVVDVVTLAGLDNGHLNLLVEEGRRDFGSLLGDGGGIAPGEGSLGGSPEGGRTECAKGKHDEYQLPCSHSRCGIAGMG